MTLENKLNKALGIFNKVLKNLENLIGECVYSIKVAEDEVSRLEKKIAEDTNTLRQTEEAHTKIKEIVGA